MTNDNILNYREYFALYSLYKNNIKAYEQCLCKDINVKMFNNIQEKLIREGYILLKNGKELIVTKKTNDIINKKNKKETLKTVKEKQEESNKERQVLNIREISEWVEKFRQPFPYNRYGNKSEIEKALADFMNKYGFDKQTILEASRIYGQERAAQNYKYTQGIVKFIKQGKLKSYCEAIVNKREIVNEDNWDGKMMNF